MTRRHESPTEQELLYDPELPAPTHAERARTLVESCRSGTLSTLAREPAGFPYGSFITFAVHQAAPVFLISSMAEHTKNLGVDARCSLLVAEASEHTVRGAEQDKRDLLALSRVTLVGHCRTVAADALDSIRAAYLAVHPSAAYYVDFNDFAFWSLAVEHTRYIGGYGRMSWVDANAWQQARPDPLAAAAPGAIAHMNHDHAGALIDYCRAFSRAREISEATMTQLDCYGFEMSAVTDHGRRPIRVAFPHPLTRPDEIRGEMIALLGRAREKLASATAE